MNREPHVMASRAGDRERQLLAVVLGRRLETVERSLDETEAALRHLARCVPPEGHTWVVRAGIHLTRARQALDDLMRRAGPPAPARQTPPGSPKGEPM